MAVSDGQLAGVREGLDKILKLLDSDSKESGWSKALGYLEDIAAAVGNVVLADGTLTAQRTMRVSLESIFLQDPREYKGLSRFTRSVPSVFVDATGPSEKTENVIPCRIYKFRP